MRGLAAMRYCTPEGGSGFIPSSQVPTLSTFDITQESPVYDQTTAWLRDQDPGTYTNYQDFSNPALPAGVLNGAGPGPSDAGYYPSPSASCAGIGDLYLRRADVLAPLPSIVQTANGGCGAVLPSCPNEVTNWIANNPLLAAALAFGGAWLLFGRKR